MDPSTQTIFQINFSINTRVQRSRIKILRIDSPPMLLSLDFTMNTGGFKWNRASPLREARGFRTGVYRMSHQGNYVSRSQTFNGTLFKALPRKSLKCFAILALAAGLISSMISFAFWLRNWFIAWPITLSPFSWSITRNRARLKLKSTNIRETFR